MMRDANGLREIGGFRRSFLRLWGMGLCLVGSIGCGLLGDFDPPDVTDAGQVLDTGTPQVDAGSPEADADIRTCPDGWVVCDGECIDPSLDLLHCGGCGNICETFPQASVLCIDGRCESECDLGFENCNGDWSDGCEVFVDDDLDHCGACGVVCDVPNATASCIAGGCDFVCEVGFENCNEDWSDGCEVALTEEDNCGACEWVCGATEVCSGMACTPRMLSAGGYHTCVLETGGLVSCWGRNQSDQLGRATGEVCGSGWQASACDGVPGPVSTLHDVVTISAGGDFASTRHETLTSFDAHTCAVTGAGELYCWGAAESGQLGVSLSEDRTHVPMRVGSLPAVQSVSASPAYNVASGSDGTFDDVGHAHTCAIVDASVLGASAGEVYCWGDNTYGQLGDGLLISRSLPMPVFSTSPLMPRVQSVHTGARASCALGEDRSVYCWGDNRNRQLGVYPETTGSVSPLRIAELSDVEEIAMGRLHVCARLSSGRVKCWGDNEYGQLGINNTTHKWRPTEVVRSRTMPFTEVRQIAAGAHHTCAIVDETAVPGGVSGAVYCWGRNSQGQLGSATSDSTRCGSDSESNACVRRPQRVPGIANAEAISLGKMHSCAMLTDGSVWCWGNRTFRQLGSGMTDPSPSVLTPTPIFL